MHVTRTTMNQGRKGIAAAACTLAVCQVMALPVPVPTVTDIGLESGFQDSMLEGFQHGRTSLAVDLDLDGWIDFVIGNPGDQTAVIRNAGLDGSGMVHFELVQVLMEGEKAYGGAAFDYDNDGDYDIFITNGGIEGLGRCALFRNELIESGTLSFTDVTDEAGVRGAIPPGETEPVEDAHADATCGDYDQDGDVDVFVSVFHYVGQPSTAGRNILWRNNGDGTFTDVSDETGLADIRRASLHSCFVDIDNDSDLDLYENNFTDLNVLWKNQLRETGFATFTNVTADFSPPNQDVAYPFNSFVAAAQDINNDGWQDIVAFARGGGEPGPYAAGHAIFINQDGTGFVNQAEVIGINTPFAYDEGVMGCQLGDVNADGVLDAYIGTGNADARNYDQLWISDALAAPPGNLPKLLDMSWLVNFPAPEDGVADYPMFPYRTHGINFVDVDNDGDLEIAVVNGGHSDVMHETGHEPNRLFKVDWPNPINYFKVRPVGDGIHVSKDAIGTRMALTVSEGGGTPWTIYLTLAVGSAFSSQQGYELYFGLGNADAIHSLTVTWPDGSVQTLTEGLAPNTRNVVTYPDPCDTESGSFVDCNSNGAPDECDVRDGSSVDCNLDLVPDECQSFGAFADAGAAIAFDAVDDYVEAPDSSILDLTSAFTIEAWLRPDVTTGSHAAVVKRTPNDRGYSLRVDEGVLVFAAAGVQDYATTAAYVSPGAWMHVAVVMDAVNDAHFYVNGEPVETVAGDAAVIVSSAPFQIGRREPFTGGAESWDGTIDEVRVWNIARSDAEIAADYDVALTGAETGLVGYWRFSEGSGTLAADSAGDNDATVIGGAQWAAPAGACVAIVSSVPEDGAIDARQPTDPDGTNRDGWSSLTLSLDAEVPVDARNVLVSVDPPGKAPAVVNVTQDASDVTVSFDGPIPLAAWTTVSLGGYTSVRIGHLPGDVSGDATTASTDLLVLINVLNGILERPDYAIDIDRSGAASAGDLLRVVDLLNGAGEYESWLGRTLP